MEMDESGVDNAEAEIRRLRDRAEGAENSLRIRSQELDAARADLVAIKATRRYRIGAAIARPFDRLRRTRSRLLEGAGTSATVPAEPAPFIVGVPRSGTTLLRLMLNAHPELAIPPETLFITALNGLPSAGDVRRAFLETVTTFDTWPDLGVDARRLELELRRIEPFDVGAGVRAVYRLYAERFGKRRFGDKTPNYALHTGAIRALLPEARFVHIIRDGRDVALSVRSLWFRPGDTIEAIAADWRDRIETVRRDRAGDERYLELRYEDLVAAPGDHLRRICEFLELSCHPDMTRYWEKGSVANEEFRPYTARDGTLLASSEGRIAHYRSAATPVAPERAGRWRHELSGEECRVFEQVAGKLLSDLGYETSEPTRA